MEIPAIVLAKIVFRRPGLPLRVGKGSTTIPKAGHVKRSTRKPRNALKTMKSWQAAAQAMSGSHPNR